MKILKRHTAVVAAPLAMATSAALAGSPALSGLVGEADSAESAFGAPAAMSRLEGSNLTIQTMYALSQADFEVDESLTEVDGGNPDKGADPIIIPSVYYVRELSDDWHAGLSLTVPSGFGSDYGGQWAGRYQTVEFSLVYVALTPAVSYRLTDSLSIGASVGINYTAETSELKIPQPGGSDGKITSDLDGVGFNLTLSAFYEFSERTRGGISWTSDADADLEGDVELRDLSPVFDDIAERRGIKSIDTKITNTLPQRVLAGIYHQFESGRYITLDGMWMKFSDFSVSNIELNGEDLDVSSPEVYDDFWAITTGMGFPVSERLTYKVGAMYVSQPVDDDVRSFSIRLDEMWGFGAGLTYKLAGDRRLDLNANYINVGKAGVDTEDSDPGRRIVGENDDPYALLFELTYHL